MADQQEGINRQTNAYTREKYDSKLKKFKMSSEFEKNIFDHPFVLGKH